LRIGCRGDGIEEFHVGQVVNIDLLVKHKHHPLAVHANCKNGHRKPQLADDCMPLGIMRASLRTLHTH